MNCGGLGGKNTVGTTTVGIISSATTPTITRSSVRPRSCRRGAAGVLMVRRVAPRSRGATAISAANRRYLSDFFFVSGMGSAVEPSASGSLSSISTLDDSRNDATGLGGGSGEEPLVGTPGLDPGLA